MFAEDNGPGRASTDPDPGVHVGRGPLVRAEPGPRVSCNAGAPSIDLPVALTWARSYPTLPPSVNLLQIELKEAVETGKGLYTQVGSYFPTSWLVPELNAMDLPTWSFTANFVTSGLPVQVSVAVSTDGNIALYALQATNGHCAYAEDNEEAYPGTSDGLAGATATSGFSYAPGRDATSCFAGQPPAGLAWRATPPRA